MPIRAPDLASEPRGAFKPCTRRTASGSGHHDTWSYDAEGRVVRRVVEWQGRLERLEVVHYGADGSWVFEAREPTDRYGKPAVARTVQRPMVGGGVQVRSDPRQWRPKVRTWWLDESGRLVREWEDIAGAPNLPAERTDIRRDARGRIIEQTTAQVRLNSVELKSRTRITWGAGGRSAQQITERVTADKTRVRETKVVYDADRRIASMVSGDLADNGSEHRFTYGPDGLLHGIESRRVSRGEPTLTERRVELDDAGRIVGVPASFEDIR